MFEAKALPLTLQQTALKVNKIKNRILRGPTVSIDWLQIIKKIEIDINREGIWNRTAL